jgi:hypothetical protein
MAKNEAIMVREEDSIVPARTPDMEMTARSSAEAVAIIQASAVLAKQFPRNDGAVLQKVVTVCKKPRFAEKARYAFPRGGQTISGPSVVLMREMARISGNIHYGMVVVRDTDDERTIEGWAWDVESNHRESLQDSFKKLIQRKVYNRATGEKETQWVTPDERDLRELTLRRAAILVRNCLRRLLPWDLVDEALSEVEKTIANQAATDPEGTKKAVLLNFAKRNVDAAEIEEYLGHPIAQAVPSELVMLKGILSALDEGAKTWFELLSEKRGERNAEKPSKKAEEASLLAGAQAAPFSPPSDRTAGQKPASASARRITPAAVAKIEAKAASFGMSPDDLFDVLHQHFDGRKLGEIRADEEQDLLQKIADVAGAQ